MPRKLSGLGSPDNSGKLDLSGASFGGNPLGGEIPVVDTPALEQEEVEQEEAAQEEAEESLNPYTMTPRQLWEAELEEASVTTNEAAAILDAIMSTGKYEETYRMGGTQFKLRTRTTVDADRTIEILQDLKPEVTGVYSHIVSRINLASSIVAFGSKSFTHTEPSDDNRPTLDAEWRHRYQFCSTLPAPTFYMLTQILQRFENKVNLASDPRSLENF